MTPEERNTWLTEAVQTYLAAKGLTFDNIMPSDWKTIKEAWSDADNSLPVHDVSEGSARRRRPTRAPLFNGGDVKKVCSKCGVDKTLDEFHKHKTGGQGRASMCKPCAVARSIAWWQQHKDRHNAKARERYAQNPTRQVANSRRYKYGTDGREIYDRQKGKCAICGSNIAYAIVGKRSERSMLDHCHETGIVRGMLCDPCNVGIGRFKDDPNLLRAAAAYVEMWSVFK
jgi:hypothetical protein